VANKPKQLGTALENRVVARARTKGLAAARQPGSGVFKGFPHDATIEDILVECKVRSASVTQKGKRMLTLDLDWLRGVQADAAKAGFRSGIVVVNAKGESKPLVLVDLDFMLGLLQLGKEGLDKDASR
jgi:hypothetical protein